MAEKKRAFRMYDNDTLKWVDGDKQYCLHIQRDDSPMNPRTDMDNFTMMACFHRRYNLGDEIPEKDPDEFWLRLVCDNVSGEEVVAAAEAGKLKGLRAAKNAENPELLDIYEASELHIVFGSSGGEESLEWKGLTRQMAAYYLIDELTIGHCMTLLKPHLAWLPLWLYDHSGITMSCGTRSYPYNDRWDSSAVGWIVALKSTIMKEVGTEYVLDENGDLIKVEHPHPDGTVTFSYRTRPLTDETWRERAEKIMEEDVELYDQYLTGDVYGYTLYEADSGDEDPDWEESDSIWGFFGSDILENGIADEVGSGIYEAIAEKRYERGEATLVTTSHYEF